MSLTLDSKYYRNEDTYKNQDRYKISRFDNDSIEKKEDKNNYQSNRKKTSIFGKMMNKFKKYPSKILTAKQIRENKDFKETKRFQEGNNFIHISKNLKNKISGEEITQEVRIKGGTTNYQSDYDDFFESEQLPKENKNKNKNKNWNFQNKKKKKYKSKKKCRYGLKCRNKKNCKFNHDNDNNNDDNNNNNNQHLQNYHQKNNQFFFDDNFAATFFS
jgi:hypothetical protein|tara:strand:- start:2476 stop:3123 length:648 start_codon:yes stop_codon:yes gene_type:complete